MQPTQEMQVTPRGFLLSIGDLDPNNDVKEWTRETLGERNSSASRLKRSDVLRGIMEEERKRILTAPLDVEEMPTLYMPAIPKSPPLDTGKMAAQILQLQEEPVEDDPCVEITASAHYDTLDIIHHAVENLHSTPTLIVVSTLRWIADEKKLKRWQYHYHGVRVPIVPSDGPCDFDVRVWGTGL